MFLIFGRPQFVKIVTITFSEIIDSYCRSLLSPHMSVGPNIGPTQGFTFIVRRWRTLPIRINNFS